MKKKIIWIILAAILLLGGIAAALLLWLAPEEQADSQELTLCWNVDKDSYPVTYKDAHSPVRLEKTVCIISALRQTASRRNILLPTSCWWI